MWSPARRRSAAGPRPRPLFLLLFLLAAAPAAEGQLAPPTTGGISRLDRLLHRLSEPRRLLVIGAHPDDEDTALLALAARGYGATAAYLSLTRGEGGQNLIGNELGTALGLIRSRELESARAIDGAAQFFTRAYDFGYTRSLEETERFWPPDSILKDVVRVMRRFRPHVVVPVFSGTRRDGHGQHQMAGVMARRAFAVAGDPSAFPELAAEEGLAPWTPLKLYRSTRFDRDATTLVLPTGGLDPHTGNTYRQIASASRSQHRSQDFGSLQPIGPGQSRLSLLEDRTGTNGDRDLFDGVPTADRWLATFADSVRRHVAPSRMVEIVPALAAALRRGRDTESAPERLALVEEALAVAAGVMLDVRAASPRLIPGRDAPVTVEVYNTGPFAILLDTITLDGSALRWEPRRYAADAALSPGSRVEERLRVPVGAATPASQPYFLDRPRIGSLYDWSAVPPAFRGVLFAPPVLHATAHLSIDGTRVRVQREVTYRHRDQAVGEIREPVMVVPGMTVRLTPDRLVWSSSGPRSREFTVRVQLNDTVPVRGTVTLSAGGWRGPDAAPFALETAGASQRLAFTVTRPDDVEHADVTVRAVATTAEGERYDAGVHVLSYPHTRPTQRVVPAETRVRVAPIALPATRAIGYIRGASDRVPEALRRVGLPVAVIDAAALATGDLSHYDVIVVGARAYETDTALTRHNDRLLAFARAGGRVIVQYQQYAFVRGGYAPFALDIGRPHDRVTDETSPVKVLVPEHPLFAAPNAIGDDDWDGWPQERGLYFAGSWNEAYTPLLEMPDPERNPIRGGLLVARLGRGVYVYTGLSFFRALPAGTPGAYRLFMNLLGLEPARVP